jgi:hypothetical protein
MYKQFESSQSHCIITLIKQISSLLFSLIYLGSQQIGILSYNIVFYSSRLAKQGFVVRFCDKRQIYISNPRNIQFPANLYSALGLCRNDFYFSCKGKVVQDESEFSAQGILQGSVLFCLPKLRGGGKSSSPCIVSPSKRKAPDTSTVCGMLAPFDQPESQGEPSYVSPAAEQPRQTRPRVVLWIQNVDTKKRSPLELSDLSQVYTVEALCNLISNLNRTSKRNCQSLINVGLAQSRADKLRPFEILHSQGAEFVKLLWAEPWTYSDHGEGNILYIRVLPKSFYQIWSEKCLAIFKNPFLFEQSSEQKATIYDYLGLPPKQLPARQSKVAQILREGIGSQIQLHSVPSSSTGMSAEQQNTYAEYERRSDNWMSQVFRKTISVKDLDLKSDGRSEGELSTGMKALKSFLIGCENDKCTLNFSAQHSGRFMLESGEACHESIRVYCRSKDKLGNACTHCAVYKYMPIPLGGRFAPANKDCPIFRLVVPKEGAVLGHSCDESKTAENVGKGVQGKSSITEDKTRIAIFLLGSAFSLRMIVEAFGEDPGNYSAFQNKMKQFRHAISYVLKKDCIDDMEVLIDYFKNRADIGQSAFSCVERVSGTNKPRIFWQSAEQILFLKEGRATALSLDFVYKMIPGLGLAFGHFTAMSPSGHLVPVAQFLVECESGDAIDWVFEKFDEVHKSFELACQSPVGFLPVCNQKCVS